jgi:hypothetical protein
MGEDASLGDFSTTNDEDESEATSEAKGENGTARDDEPDADDGGVDAGNADSSGDGDSSDGDDAVLDVSIDDVAPTVTTYGWSPSDTTCKACGEPTDRRWRDGGAMVCGECKEW